MNRMRPMRMTAAFGWCLLLLVYSAQPQSANGTIAGKRFVYTIADKVTVRPEPRLRGSTTSATTVPFGAKLLVIQENEEWLQIAASGQDIQGWVHKAVVSDTASLPGELSLISLKPSTIIFISGIRDSGTFQCSIIEGRIRLGTNRLLAEHGTCIVTRDCNTAREVGGLSMNPLGVDQVISDPQPWTLYFYCSNEGQFRSIFSLLTSAKPVVAGSPRPKEKAVVGVAEQKQTGRLPSAAAKLTGSNRVRVRNPNTFSVKVALRTASGGRDFFVPPNDSSTVYVPDGRYDVYFQYSNDPNGLYQGNGFTLSENGVEIQLVKIVGDNYRIRKVK